MMNFFHFRGEEIGLSCARHHNFSHEKYASLDNSPAPGFGVEDVFVFHDLF